MKSYLYSFLFLLIPVILVAQSSKDKTIYLDSLFRQTKEKDYKYYMIVEDYKTIQQEYFITRYYLSGKMESKGISESREFFQKKGEITSYYENENIKSTILYRDRYAHGKCEFWYENGIKKMEGEYIISIEEDKTKKSNLKVINSWDKNNVQTVINGDGDYEDDESFEKEWTYLSAISKGAVKNGLKDGVWIGSSSRPNFKFLENYEKGQFISGESIDSNNEKHFYTTIEKAPEAPYGIDTFRRYIGINFRMPNDAPRGGGKIFTTFIIDENGKMINPTVVKGIGDTMDKEAIRVLSKYVNWIPGEIRGIKTRFLFSLPISIGPSY